MGVSHGHGNCSRKGRLKPRTLSNQEAFAHSFWNTAFLFVCCSFKTLQDGEKILIDTDSILCFESSVTLDVQFIGSGIACCFSGEGIFNTAMSGPGKVWLQSLGIDKMRKLFPPKVIEVGGDSGDGGDGGGD